MHVDATILVTIPIIYIYIDHVFKECLTKIKAGGEKGIEIGCTRYFFKLKQPFERDKFKGQRNRS